MLSGKRPGARAWTGPLGDHAALTAKATASPRTVISDFAELARSRKFSEVSVMSSCRSDSPDSKLGSKEVRRRLELSTRTSRYTSRPDVSHHSTARPPTLPGSGRTQRRPPSLPGATLTLRWCQPRSGATRETGGLRG